MSVKLVCGYSLLCSVCCFTSIADSQFNICGRGSAGVSVVKNVLPLEDKVYSGRESENAKTYIYLLRSSEASHCGCTCTAGLKLGAVRVESEEEFGRFRIPKKESERCGVIWSAFVSFGEEKVKFSYYFGKNYSDSFRYDKEGNALLRDSGYFFHDEKGKEILCREFRDSRTGEPSIECILRMALFRWRADDNIKTLTEFFKRVSMVGDEKSIMMDGIRVRPKYDLYGNDGYNCATFSREALFYLLGQDSQKSTQWQSIRRYAVAGAAVAAGFVAGAYLLPVVTTALAGYSIPGVPAVWVNGFALFSRVNGLYASLSGVPESFFYGVGGSIGGGFLGDTLGAGVDNRPESVVNGILSAMKERYKSADEERKRKLEDSFKIIFLTEGDVGDYHTKEGARREGISYAQRSRTLADIGSSKFQLETKAASKLKTEEGKAVSITVFLDTDFEPSDDAVTLISEVQKGCLDNVRNLLDKGISPNIRGDSGKTALMCAAQKKYSDIVNVLVERGADLNARDDSGMTALMCAAQKGREGVVSYLLAKGTSLNIQDNNGKSALIYAALEGYENIVSILMEKGADPNAQDDSGKTALICAAQKGYKNVVDILLTNRASPNIRDDSGMTALMCVAQEGYSDIVSVLAERGGRPVCSG